jgi:hypothetical protein
MHAARTAHQKLSSAAHFCYIAFCRYGEDLKGKKAQVVTVSKEKAEGAKEQQLQQQATMQQQSTLATTASTQQAEDAAAASDTAASATADTGTGRLPPIPSNNSMEEQASANAPHPFMTHQQQQQQLLPKITSMPRQQQQTSPLRYHQSSPAAFAAANPSWPANSNIPNMLTLANAASTGAGGAAGAGGGAASKASMTAAAAAAVAAAAHALPSKKLAKQAAANAKFTAKLAAMTAAELRRKYAELVIQQVGALGGCRHLLCCKGAKKAKAVIQQVGGWGPQVSTFIDSWVSTCDAVQEASKAGCCECQVYGQAGGDDCCGAAAQVCRAGDPTGG